MYARVGVCGDGHTAFGVVHCMRMDCRWVEVHLLLRLVECGICGGIHGYDLLWSKYYAMRILSVLKPEKNCHVWCVCLHGEHECQQ